MKSLSSISVKPAPGGEADVPANSSARMARPVGRYTPAKRSFTLVEMMVSMVLLTFLAYILLQITTLVETTNARVSGGVNSFQDASIAFDTLTKTLSQATLNTYIDYYPSQLGAVGTNNASTPSMYIRQSELHFVCGPADYLTGGGATALNTKPTHAVFFQAPLGYSTTYTTPPISDLLNACGFYIQFGDNRSWMPSFLPSNSSSNTYRYRLMEMLQPTEDIGVYTDPALATNVPPINDPSATNQYQSVYPPMVDISGGGTSRYDTNNYATAGAYNWITQAIAANNGGVPTYVRPLADNIIALIIQPMLDSDDQANYINEQITFPTSLDPNNTPSSFDYSYDSRRDTNNASPNMGAIPPQLPQQLEANQLPPLMQVTMVAIDEPSAIRLAAQNGTASSNLVANAASYTTGVANPDTGTLFTQTSEYATDLQQLTGYLTSIRVKYRVFTAQVPMFNAKWSTQ